MQVLHTRSCSGQGLHFVRFLAACYLAFNMDYSSVTLAMAAMPPVLLPRRPSAGEKGGVSTDVRQINRKALLHAHAGPFLIIWVCSCVMEGCPLTSGRPTGGHC
jgi:hypothetical protein